jgi:hypothetical protein
MNALRTISAFAFLLFLGMELQAQPVPLPITVQQLIELENLANGAELKSADPIQIKHYEIPLADIDLDIASFADENIRKHLIFEKNGQSYFRWLIHPTDTVYHKQIQDSLKTQKLDARPKEYFTAYQTASASLIIAAPDGFVFSAKVSTNRAGGKWVDKPIRGYDVESARKVTDYIREIAAKFTKASKIVFLYDTVGATFNGQGLVVRELGDIATGKSFGVPGFALFHETYGPKLARDSNLGRSLRQYATDWGASLGELLAVFGLWPNAPHGQNFLQERDLSGKPTGRIFFRDLTDLRIFEAISRAFGRFSLMRRLSWKVESTDGKTNQIGAAVGFLHGNVIPSWIRSGMLVTYANLAIDAYWKTVSDTLRIPLDKITPLLREKKISRRSYSSLRLKAESRDAFVKLISPATIEFLKTGVGACRFMGRSSATD